MAHFKGSIYSNQHRTKAHIKSTKSPVTILVYMSESDAMTGPLEEFQVLVSVWTKWLVREM